MRTGSGPYRAVADAELRSIFYLVSTTAKSFWFIPNFLTTTTPPPGTDKPAVTQLLRALLYVHAVPSQANELRQIIEKQLADRNDIAIRAKLLSLIGQIREKPWAFPACVATPLCRQFYARLKPIMETSEMAADFMGDPFTTAAAPGAASAVAAKTGTVTAGRIIGGAAMGGSILSLTNFFAGKSKDYYEFYMKRISDELALRGIPPSSL